MRKYISQTTRKLTATLLPMNKKILRLTVLLILLGVFLFSGWKVFSTLLEYRQSEESYKALTQEYTTHQPTATADEPQSPVMPSDTTEETAPMETAPIAVDFATLLADCPDVVGWLYCADTPINYPVVQATDNDYYLRRLLDGSYSRGGSIFMDYRCAADFSDWNSILYGHNMKNDTMFGTLEDFRKQEYYDAHPVLYLLTPAQDYKIVLIGGYTTPGDDKDTYGIPISLEVRNALIEKAQQNSTFQADAEIGDEERLITLSTCAYDYTGARYVLVGVLRELAPFVEGGNAA